MDATYSAKVVEKVQAEPLRIDATYRFGLVKQEDDDPLPFINSGECSDEVVLNFDDGKKLYASENFLCYASPVFKAMFQHDFKEKETKEVAMKEKKYDDFLEFLLCLHPGVQKPIDNGNVLRVVAFAEEYQVLVSVQKCQKLMKNWLTSEVESASKLKSTFKTSMARHAKACLDILIKSDACGFHELVTYAISVTARFGHDVFNGTVTAEKEQRKQECTALKGLNFARTVAPPPLPPLVFGTPPMISGNIIAEPNAVSLSAAPSVVAKIECPVKGCKERFDNLREELKIRLFLQRLKLCDDGEMY